MAPEWGSNPFSTPVYTSIRSPQNSFLSDLESAAQGGSASFWSFYKCVCYPRSPRSRVFLDQLLNVLVPRMNPPDPDSAGFNALRLQEEERKADSIPTPSLPSSHPIFNSVVTSDNIAAIKTFLEETQHSDYGSG
ncbi:hypothetical protein GYMLUDRAFT_61235 [Collybiopsis luxurians FD-317 M1]|uniref:Uncharacterized protein n=1 Tax=Collybiopsis luxurians FD-317 M1 TaxID=944289 RepID=A0A0D0CQ22_9AGAR|nr:hypothetical protein GYMLUDRAFT_61235 [Collybiopsis luxurians FD-317 M1]